MNNYRIWKTDDEDIILIEFWNKCDAAVIQERFIEKGYYIIRTEFNVFDCHFIKAEKIKGMLKNE